MGHTEKGRCCDGIEGIELVKGSQRLLGEGRGVGGKASKVVEGNC